MTHQEPPKKTCQKCKDQTCLKTGKPCDEIEKLLPKPTTGHGRKEHSFDPYVLDYMSGEQACKIKFGKRKEPYREPE
jgi:hypothetical protein